MLSMENGSSYNEIEPRCKWIKEEHQEILEVNLPAFKKEQLRVQINNRGILTISGESAPDGNRRDRFRKEVNIHKDCKRDDIRAKFSGQTLSITMPKRIPMSFRQQRAQTDQRTQENEELKQNVEKDKLPAAAAVGTAAASSMLRKPTKFISGLKFSVPRLRTGGKTALKLGALAGLVVVVAGGAYFAYKYRSAFHVDD